MPLYGMQNVDLSGGMGGLFAGINQAQEARQKDASVLETMLKNKQQMLESSRFEQMTPLELLLSQQKIDKGMPDALAGKTIAQNPEFMQRVVAGQLGTQDEAAAKGAIALGTQESTIGKTNSANKLQMQQDAMLSGLQTVQQAMTALEMGGGAGEAEYNQLVGSVKGPIGQILQRIPPQARPVILPKLMEKLKEGLLLNSQALQKFKEIQMQGNNQLAVERERAKRGSAEQQRFEKRQLDATTRNDINVRKTHLTTLIRSAKDAIAAIDNEYSDFGDLKRQRRAAALAGVSGATARQDATTKFLREFAAEKEAKKDAIRQQIDQAEGVLTRLQKAQYENDPEKRARMITEALDYKPEGAAAPAPARNPATPTKTIIYDNVGQGTEQPL